MFCIILSNPNEVIWLAGDLNFPGTYIVQMDIRKAIINIIINIIILLVSRSLAQHKLIRAGGDYVPVNH